VDGCLLQRNAHGVSVLDRAAVRVARTAVRATLHGALHAADDRAGPAGPAPPPPARPAGARGQDARWDAGAAKLGEGVRWDEASREWVQDARRETVRYDII
jgi:hypothetical protein